jgi:hypothetical protein
MSEGERLTVARGRRIARRDRCAELAVLAAEAAQDVSRALAQSRSGRRALRVTRLAGGKSAHAVPGYAVGGRTRGADANCKWTAAA